MLGGCAILEAICATWPVGRLRVADRGVREGMLIDLLQGADVAAEGAGRESRGRTRRCRRGAGAHAARAQRSSTAGSRASSTIPMSPRQARRAIARAPPSS